MLRLSFFFFFYSQAADETVLHDADPRFHGKIPHLHPSLHLFSLS